MCNNFLIFHLLILTLSSTSIQAQLFELDTQYDNGWYSFSFYDGFYPVTFGVNQGSGGIYFNIPDATRVIVPNNWVITNYEGGFLVAYDGTLDTYPLGFETVEISFFSSLSIDEIGNGEDGYTGMVYGPLVLENGYSPGGMDLGNGAYVSAPFGYASFYFDMPTYEGPQLTAQNLIDLFGFTLDDIKPTAAGIELKSSEIRVYLGNVIEGATYMLQYKEAVEATNWVNIKTFTHEDLDENKSIGQRREGLSGFFRVTML